MRLFRISIENQKYISITNLFIPASIAFEIGLSAFAFVSSITSRVDFAFDPSFSSSDIHKGFNWANGSNVSKSISAFNVKRTVKYL